MEPQPTPTPVQPAPVMDVVPPPQPPAAESTPPPVGKNTVPVKEEAPAVARKLAHGPVLAISLAIILFVALSLLAYYAYTKSN